MQNCCELLTFSNVSIVNFEEVNVSWEVSGSGCRHRSRKISAVIERSSQLNVRIVKSN